MAETPSKMIELGTQAPAFALPNVDGTTVSLADYDDRTALLVMFICNHCPFVKHIRSGLAQLGRDYRNQDVGIVAISANDAQAYPADSPERMKIEAQQAGYSFPYLYDESQEVARAYGAACTPDFFVYDRDRRLVYRGQFDDSRPSNGKAVTGRDLRAALDAVLAGTPIAAEQRASIGCNIKWRAGGGR